jgi:beta-phosphoglucomutase-like phosphatase (HAD superfamily)
MSGMTIQRTEPSLTADERTMLEGWLDYHRETLAIKCAGLDDARLRTASVPPSELSLLGLGEQLDGIYISSDYLCRKPDTKFYQALINEQGLKVENCLMIGNDRHTDIAGAKALGMDTLYMHTALTPPDQEPADPALLPGCGGPNYEYEGDNWADLVTVIEKLLEEN